MDSLKAILQAQAKFESLFVDFDLIKSDSDYLDRTAEYLSTALARESFEFRDEFNWKVNARKKPGNRDKQIEEAIDCFTFSLNLLLILGLSAEEVAEYYRLKNRINWDRQVKSGRITEDEIADYP